jgi:hypothetical protein
MDELRIMAEKHEEKRTTLPFQISDVVVTESVHPIGFHFRNYSCNIAGKI